MKKILIITNGHGEDQVARLILEQLSSDFKLSVLPLVGQGLEFKDNKTKTTAIINSPIESLSFAP